MRPFCTSDNDSAVIQLMSQDTSRSARTSHASGSRSIQPEILNFPLITYFRYHVTEYCAVIGTHSTVRGNKLLYGLIPDPFPRCGIGSGHARLGRTMGLPGHNNSLLAWAHLCCHEQRMMLFMLCYDSSGPPLLECHCKEGLQGFILRQKSPTLHPSLAYWTSHYLPAGHHM